MKIMIAGGSGFIGSALSEALSSDFDLTLLSRSKDTSLGCYKKRLTWQELNAQNISDYAVIINLCGYNIAAGRWTKQTKAKIIQSRIEPTLKLVKLIGNNNIWLINASAIGFYPFSSGRQSEGNYIKNDRKAFSFCQKVTHQWESIVNESQQLNSTILRFGVVIGQGGVLQKLLPSAKVGLGLKIGTGNQHISWIGIDDLCQAVKFIIDHKLKEPVFNMTAPVFCTQKELIDTICSVLKRPRIFKLPAVMVKLLFGQMGEELLLGQHCVVPENLIQKGFQFKHRTIQSCLNDVLGSR